MEGSGFRKLRIALTASVLGSSVVPAAAPRAAASSVPLSNPVIGPSSARWHFANNAAVPLSFNESGFGFISGVPCTISTTTPTTIYNCPPDSFPELDDPFVTGYLWETDDEVFKDANGILDVDPVNDHTYIAWGTLDGGDLDVKVTATLFAPRVLRLLYTFTNMSPQKREYIHQRGTQFSSGADTRVEVSSAEPYIHITKKDRWGIIGESSNAMQNAFVLSAVGDCLSKTFRPRCTRPTIISEPEHGAVPDVWKTQYKHALGPGQMRSFLFFVAVAPQFSDLYSIKDRFSSGRMLSQYGYLNGLTLQQLKSIRNWKKLQRFIS